MKVRPARSEDIDDISAWTRDTFDWGDYVPERLPEWLADPDSYTVVCLDGQAAVGVSNTVMLSDTEAWLEGARVHPDHRRRGIGSLMNRAGLEWAFDRGARVARLGAEEDNAAARGQVEAMGYRQTSKWAHARLNPMRNPPTDYAVGLQPAPSADIDAAWLSWISGELSRPGREMLALNWRWRTATPADLGAAVREGAFFQSPAGWLIADQPERGWLRCGWMATTPDAAPQLIDDLLRTAREWGVEEVTVKVPWTPWMVEALVRAGDEPGALIVYAVTP